MGKLRDMFTKFGAAIMMSVSPQTNMRLLKSMGAFEKDKPGGKDSE